MIKSEIQETETSSRDNNGHLNGNCVLCVGPVWYVLSKRGGAGQILPADTLDSLASFLEIVSDGMESEMETGVAGTR